MSNCSKVSSVDEFDGPEYGGLELESADFKMPEPNGDTKPVRIKNMPAFNKIPSVTKMRDRDCSVNTKVVWDEASLASQSVRSHTDKTTRFDLSSKGNRKTRQNWFSKRDASTSEVARALKKFDEDLQNIVMEQNYDLDNPILSVNGNDLQKIKLLGRGQYCSVTSVAGTLPYMNRNDGEQDAEQSRKRFVYALKAVDVKRVKSDEDMIIAASDLASEAKILAELNHKNIIKLRGLCCETFSRSFAESRNGASRRSIRNKSHRNASLRSFRDSMKRLASFNAEAWTHSLKMITSMRFTKSNDGVGGYFLLLDVLTEVLSDRLTKERRNIERAKRQNPKHKFTQTKEEMHDRIKHIVTGIVDGMQYLHSHDIVLRDLKPGNVGFDDGTNVRLFDFGMARRVSECAANEICGSPRYMAPEIMEGRGYSLKVDVYSFGIILYELCTLEVPFSRAFNQMKAKKNKNTSCLSSIKSVFKVKPRASKPANTANNENKTENEGGGPPKSLLLEFYRRVVCDELRPSDNNLDQVIPCPQVGKLVKECWSADPDERPSFDEIGIRLDAIFNSR